jgi:hypothetical protein
MQDSIRTQMKQLCESIASEQDPVRFMELVTRLNELLQRDEANSPSPLSACRARHLDPEEYDRHRSQE